MHRCSWFRSAPPASLSSFLGVIFTLLTGPHHQKNCSSHHPRDALSNVDSNRALASPTICRHLTSRVSRASSSPWPSPVIGSKTSFSSCRPSTTGRTAARALQTHRRKQRGGRKEEATACFLLPLPSTLFIFVPSCTKVKNVLTALRG